MRRNKVMLMAVAGLISLNSFGQTVDEIVEKNIAATGGVEKLKSVNNIVTERSLSVSGMEIPTVTTLMVGKKMRTESTVMGNSMIQVVDGTTGWMIMPTMMGGTGEPADMPEDQVKQQLGQLDPFPMIDYKSKGSSIELVGKEQLDKKDVFHLKFKDKDGKVADEYLDANTYLLTKLKMDIGGQEAEINFSDYKTVDGIQLPFAMDMTNPQMGVLTFVTTSVKVNTKVDENIFQRPKK